MKKKIVIIGAGSSVFGPATFSDLYLSKILEGSTIVLCDIDKEKLEMIYQLLNYENKKAGNKFILEQTHNSCIHELHVCLGIWWIFPNLS